MPYDVLLVDDHKIMRDGLKAILKALLRRFNVLYCHTDLSFKRVISQC